MHLLLALVLAAAPAAEAPPAPVQRLAAERQALAMVRILPGAALRFSEIEKNSPESFRDTLVRGVDGSPEPARLVEFQ